MTEQQEKLHYGDYLQLNKLLNSQNPVTDAHDEMQFIIVHQTFELQFKLMLFELDACKQALYDGDVLKSQHYIRRVQTILRVIPAIFDVIETMRPYDFLQFREHLMPASGLQSAQFREVEYLSGQKDDRYLMMHEGDDRANLQRRIDEPSIWEAFVDLLKQNDMDTTDDAAVVKSLIEILKDHYRHPLGHITQDMLEYDKLFALWRSRHVMMAMRMIGSKAGTGKADVKKLVDAGYVSFSTGGVEYLKSTSPKYFFPLIWEALTFVEY